MARKVTVIPQKPAFPVSENVETEQPKRRVAAYARVSTDCDEQQTSYEAQVSYYTEYIKNHEDWEFVGIYADEGISGCSTTKREQFNLMIKDALDGRIDLIVTKSVSRFARNTVDSLTAVRKLKEKGVEVYFQKENIYTLDSKGELLITIMSSLAQEESRSISENITWGKRKQMADGKVSLPYSRFMGYRKGADGLPEIVPEEAEVIRFIYRRFIAGDTPYRIAGELTERNIPTPAGKENWAQTTVLSILTNEKYKGSALLQKKFTVDFLTKKTKVNEGEVPQYYIEQSHQAIIKPEEFELVQAEIARRKEKDKYYHSKNPLANRIICSECGEFYGPKVWHSTSEKYRRVIWQCNGKYRHQNGCTTPHLGEKEIKEKFLIAYNRLFLNRDLILEACKAVQDVLSDCCDLDLQIDRLAAQMHELEEKVRCMIIINSKAVQVQECYKVEYNRLNKDYDALNAELKKLQTEKAKRQQKSIVFREFMQEIRTRENLLNEFDVDLWIAVIESVIVFPNGKMCFTFKDGTEITV